MKRRNVDAFELGSSPNIAFTGLFEIKGPNGETGGNNTNAATYAAGANATPAAAAPAMASHPSGSTGTSGSSGSGSGSGSGSTANTQNSGQTAGNNGASVVKSDATKVNVAGALAIAAGIASVFMF